jgi:hypothetical protein
MTSVLPSGSTLRGDGHVLVAGVDGVRFDLVGPQITPSVWGIGQAGPGVAAGGPPLITRLDQVAALVLSATS